MVSPLTKEERIFLAGCIKSMLLADGSIEPQEISELDVLIKNLRFTDYETCLTEFESSVNDDEAFWDMAKTIRRPEAQQVILDCLRSIQLHEGIPERSQEHFVARLKTAWQT